MKPALTAFLIVSFFAVAALGVFLMNHGGGHGDGGCIAAAAQGADCPSENILSFLLFHLDAFRSFSVAVFGNFSWLALLLSAFLLAFFGAPVARCVRRNSPLGAFFFARQFATSPDYLIRRQFSRWSALHERSPNAA